MTSYVYRNVNEALPALMREVLDAGVEVDSRAGKTRELRFVQVTLTNPCDREILLPTRKASLPAQIAETMWVLSGRGDVEWLSHYLPRAADFSDDGDRWRGAYGPRLRAWEGRNGGEYDQLQFVVDLLRVDPGTRRAVMTIFDPVIDAEPGKDIPCNNWLHFLARDGRLDLHVAIRSNDLMWGWSGINAFEWSTLLEVVAGLVGLAVGQLHFSISSLHLYEQHWDKARTISKDRPLVACTPRQLFVLGSGRGLHYFDQLCVRWFDIEHELRTRKLGAEHLIKRFPEPMLRGWLHVLAAHWSDNPQHLYTVAGEPLYTAALVAAKRVNKADTSFPDFVDRLHRDKDAVYGDSWKKRGETLGILANIARKVDRLGDAGGGDTAADTGIDLLVYLIKYLHWLREHRPLDGDITEHVKELHVDTVARDLHALESLKLVQREDTVGQVKSKFTALEAYVQDDDPGAIRQIVGQLIYLAYPFARDLWAQQR